MALTLSPGTEVPIEIKETYKILQEQHKEDSLPTFSRLNGGLPLFYFTKNVPNENTAYDLVPTDDEKNVTIEKVTGEYMLRQLITAMRIALKTLEQSPVADQYKYFTDKAHILENPDINISDAVKYVMYIQRGEDEKHEIITRLSNAFATCIRSAVNEACKQQNFSLRHYLAFLRTTSPKIAFHCEKFAHYINTVCHADVASDVCKTVPTVEDKIQTDDLTIKNTDNAPISLKHNIVGTEAHLLLKIPDVTGAEPFSSSNDEVDPDKTVKFGNFAVYIDKPDHPSHITVAPIVRIQVNDIGQQFSIEELKKKGVVFP